MTGLSITGSEAGTGADETTRRKGGPGKDGKLDDHLLKGAPSKGEKRNLSNITRTQKTRQLRSGNE